MVDYRSTRVHYRRHNTKNTRSNKIKIIRAPGGQLTVQYRKKGSKGPRTPATLGHKKIAGIKHMSAMERANAKKKDLTVSRAYGGVLTHDLVRERIIRAFLIEEQKIVKRVLRSQGRRRRGKKSKKN
eukprot:NODE_11182_length_559_cov_624.880734_g10900_i0.p1 GENE.NODE_11182_length_559_cov_624.880734_g10900_i0~~NODE_11182_length_559_cov_624.880734_g10900_i0.p1  ORF type:complete len:127 (-),score=29.05 NODE_11182_length_559_cov_624.880734_g10900_i0:119-499(-)